MASMLGHLEKSNQAASKPSLRPRRTAGKASTDSSSTSDKKTKKRPASGKDLKAPNTSKVPKTRNKDVSAQPGRTLQKKPGLVDLTVSDAEDDVPLIKRFRPSFFLPSSVMVKSEEKDGIGCNGIKKNVSGGAGSGGEDAKAVEMEKLRAEVSTLQAELKKTQENLQRATARATDYDLKSAECSQERAGYVRQLDAAKEAEQQKIKILTEAHKQQLDSIKAEHRRVEQSFKEEKDRTVGELRASKAEQTILKAALDSYKKKVNRLEIERDELRVQLQNQQRESTTTISTLQAENNSLQRNLDEETRAHGDLMKQLDNASQSTPTVMPASTPSPVTSVFSKTRLPTPATSSFASSGLSDMEQKTENVRQTYVRLKRKHDTINAIAKEICFQTKGMDLSSFGEFGHCLKQLKLEVEKEEGGKVGPG